MKNKKIDILKIIYIVVLLGVFISIGSYAIIKSYQTCNTLKNYIKINNITISQNYIQFIQNVYWCKL